MVAGAARFLAEHEPAVAAPTTSEVVAPQFQPSSHRSAWVASDDELAKALAVLRSASSASRPICMDCEWRPGDFLVQVLSLAARAAAVDGGVVEVFLLDMQKFRRSEALQGFLVWLLASKRLYVFSPANDILKLAQSLAWPLETTPVLWYHVRDMQRCARTSAKSAGGAPIGLQQHDHELPSLQSCVREVLGIEMSKEEQCSDWAARPLSAAQRQYAALDVFFLLRLVEQAADHSASATPRTTTTTTCASASICPRAGAVFEGSVPTFGPLSLTHEMKKVLFLVCDDKKDESFGQNEDNELDLQDEVHLDRDLERDHLHHAEDDKDSENDDRRTRQRLRSCCPPSEFKTLACYRKTATGERKKFLCMLPTKSRLAGGTAKMKGGGVSGGLQLASDVVAQFGQQRGYVGPVSPFSEVEILVDHDLAHAFDAFRVPIGVSGCTRVVTLDALVHTLGAKIQPLVEQQGRGTDPENFSPAATASTATAQQKK